MTTQCICPVDLEELVMIEYPGFVKNPDKALETLGNMDSIERVFATQKDRLELKFRPADPFCRPAYGDRIPKKCLVLKIKNIKSGHATDDKKCYSLDIVGKVQTSFSFDTLAEFQWLPMQRTNPVSTILSNELQKGVKIQRTPESLDPKYSSILDDVLPIKNPFDNTLKNFNPDAPLLLLPAVFSRFDTPREIHQPHPKFRSKEMRDEFERQQSLSIIGRTRKKRSTMSYLLNFGDKIPDKVPDRIAKERHNLPAPEKALIPKLERCFDKQKVWSKAALCYELNIPPTEIKYALPLVAYHYTNGPFRTMWVCYGYDPHKDPLCKVLQTLDFRVKHLQDQNDYSRRCINQYQLPMRKNPEKSKNKQHFDLKTMISSTTTSFQYSTNDSIEDSLNGFKGFAITEAMCKFRKDLIPVARQLSYQLKDIEIEEVQTIVHSNDGREPDICSEKDGWLPEGSIERIRKIMTNSLKETLNLMTNQLEASQ